MHDAQLKIYHLNTLVTGRRTVRLCKSCDPETDRISFTSEGSFANNIKVRSFASIHNDKETFHTVCGSYKNLGEDVILPY